MPQIDLESFRRRCAPRGDSDKLFVIPIAEVRELVEVAMQLGSENQILQRDFEERGRIIVAMRAELAGTKDTLGDVVRDRERIARELDAYKPKDGT